MKDNERILKSSREKETVTYIGVPIRLSADIQKKLCRLEGLVRNFQSYEKQGPTANTALVSKAIIWTRRADKEFTR